MTAPTNYSYRNHQSKTRAKREDRWARPVSGAPNVHAARGRNTRKNTSAEQTKHSVMLASTGGDDEPPTFTHAGSSERTYENSVAAIHMRKATPLPAAYSIDQCRESGITKALPTSRVLQLYDRDRKDTPSIKQCIEKALGPKRVPLNAALMESHVKRTDESRTADYKSDRPRGSDGRVEWSEKSLAMMRAIALQPAVPSFASLTLATVVRTCLTCNRCTCWARRRWGWAIGRAKGAAVVPLRTEARNLLTLQLPLSLALQPAVPSFGSLTLAAVVRTCLTCN